MDKLPFIIHPVSVALILARYTCDEDVISAALLHDTLEDVRGYTFEKLRRDFGKKVAKIVKSVSEDKDPNVPEDKRATWQARKEKYLENLNHESAESLMVACADKIHNVRSITEEYKANGERLWKRFNAPKEKIFWFFGEVLKPMKGRVDEGLVLEYAGALNRAKKVVGVC